MKNYYEILEISQNASKEIIDKAYRVLAKKYHPDSNKPEDKQWAEEQFKEINEAYEVLSDENKKREYDQNLINANTQNNETEEYEKLNEENEKLKLELEHLKYMQKNENMQNEEPYKEQEYNTNQQYNTNQEYEQTIKNAYQQAYNEAYVQGLKNMGVKIKYKKNYKDYLAIILTFVIIIGVGALLWNIPFTKQWLISIYQNNPGIKETADFIINLIQSFSKN